MIICPQCGASYVEFQPNCDKCGAPLQAKAVIPPAPAGELSLPPSAPAAELPMPPPAPRAISGFYMLRLLFTDPRWISGSILIFIGLIFSAVGALVVLDKTAALFGMIFMLPGLAMLGFSGTMLFKGFRRAHRVVGVLRNGETASGHITDLRLNYSVSLNGLHPWIVSYAYSVNGQNYTDKVSTIIPPGQRLQQGREVRILYQSDDPQLSTIYPHP